MWTRDYALKPHNGPSSRAVGSDTFTKPQEVTTMENTKTDEPTVARAATGSVEAAQDGDSLRAENERLRDELETALAWHEVATSRREEAEATLGRIRATLRAISGRASQYAHDATNAGHAEAAEGFHEITTRIDSARGIGHE